MTVPLPASGPRRAAAAELPLLKPRLPLLMRVLALLSLIAGMWGAVGALAELMGGVRVERKVFISRVHDRQLALYDQLQSSAAAAPAGGQVGAPALPLLAPLLRLPRAELEPLSLQLGDKLYEQLPVAIPLALLQILLSWLLLTGSLGVLRRQAWALPLWSWACMVNIPYAMLSIIVTLTHSRVLRDSLGPQVAAVLAKVSGRPLDAELYNVHQLVRLYVGWQAALLALWVLLLGSTAIYLQRFVVRSDSP